MNWPSFVRESLIRHGAVPDAAVVEELSQHAAASFEAARAEGLGADVASARVRMLVDGWCVEAAHLRRRPRRASVVEPPAGAGHGWIGFSHDLRYGARLLWRQPGFALLAILLIALGVGATTTLGSLTYAVLLKPLSWPDANRIVLLSEVREGAKRTPPNILTNATYLAWREAPATLESLAGYSASTVTLTTGTDPERIRVARTTASLFTVLRARPAEGRLFTADDEVNGRDKVIVLSFDVWQRRFAASSDAIGQMVELDGERFRIVACMPRDFVFPNRTVKAWTPLRVPPVVGADPTFRSISLFRSVGRLRDGVTPAQAAAEGTARGVSAPNLGMVGTAVFGTQGPPRVSAVPYLESLTTDVRPALYILLAAVVLLLAASVANVAGMQLTRATTRRREMAIRAALGAGSGRLARQLLTENLVIGACGGLLGWVVALALHAALPKLLPVDFPRTDEILADWHVLAFAVIAALGASVVFGTLPALVARRLRLVETLVEDSLAPAGGGTRSHLGQLRAGIMAGQVAIAAILLVGASLLGQSFFAQLQVDRGYNPHNLLTVTLPLPGQLFSGRQRAALVDAVVDRLSRVPGVTAAGGASMMPLVQYDQPMSFQMPAGPGRPEPTAVTADFRSVSPGYFAALGVSMLEGRGFSDQDSLTSQQVAVVNRTFAKAYLGDRALGVKLPLSFIEGRPEGLEIVGVVDDMRQQGATDAPRPEIFNTYHQLPEGMSIKGAAIPTPVIVARTSGDPAALAGTLRSIVSEQNASVSLDSVMTMDERLLASLARPRLYAVLLGAFAGFALLVAGAGLFGVLSYSVAQRTREIGVRAALGAQPADIVGLVVRQGVAVTLVGLVAGLGAATVLVRYIGTMLYGVTTRDPLSYVLVAVALAIVAALASAVPALRAAKIDPLKAMRS
jgi:predicted permease